MSTTARKQDITKSSFIKNYAWYGIQSIVPQNTQQCSCILLYRMHIPEHSNYYKYFLEF